MENNDIKNIEIELIINSIYHRYGYDFNNYSRASLTRRILDFYKNSKAKNISDIIPKILYSEEYFYKFINYISIPVTEVFRDPMFFEKLRCMVIPILKTYPFVKIWIAGCATGEEVYSAAILLTEEDIYNQCQLFVTDFNPSSLAKATSGIYSLSNLPKYEENYKKSGGKNKLSDFIVAKYDFFKFHDELKRNIVFSHHNLVTDGSFGEMHLILCRNVMIYFNPELKNRVLKKIHDSLCDFGFLCLGTKENLLTTDFANKYCAIDKNVKIFKKNSRDEYAAISYNG